MLNGPIAFQEKLLTNKGAAAKIYRSQRTSSGRTSARKMPALSKADAAPFHIRCLFINCFVYVYKSLIQHALVRDGERPDETPNSLSLTEERTYKHFLYNIFFGFVFQIYQVCCTNVHV